MPTRKQRRREAKLKRHEYETVYVDSEGNEVEVDDAEEPKERSRRGEKAAAKPAKGKAPATRGRAPQPPSWERAGRRALMLGAVVFALFYFTGRKSGANWASALGLAALYTVLFVPFTYAVDRFAYRRYLTKTGQALPAADKGKKPFRKR